MCCLCAAAPPDGPASAVPSGARGRAEPAPRRTRPLRRVLPLSAGRRRCSAGAATACAAALCLPCVEPRVSDRRSSLHRSGQLGATSHRAFRVLRTAPCRSSVPDGDVMSLGTGEQRTQRATAGCGRKATRTRGCGWKEATHIRLRPCARHVSRSASEEAAARSRPRCDMSMTARYEYDGGENVGFSPPSYSSRRPSMGALLCRTRGHGAGCRTERRAH